jgi:hypothetical protein
VKRLISRTAALGLSVTLALGAAAVPSAAGETAAKAGGKLTRLSPASRQVLTSPRVSPKLRRSDGGQQASGPTSPGPFFKSTRGKVTLVLMGAGTVLTLWSIQHDRKPVKSPIR